MGDGTTTDERTPVQVVGLSNVVAVAAGQYHTAAVKSDGTVWAWGFNGYGQLGDGTTTDQHAPIQVMSLSGVMAVGVGGYHTVALKSDGTVWCWGDNWYGQVGDGTTTDRHAPVQVEELDGVVVATAGEWHTVALKSDGTVWAWGCNAHGQLGDGTQESRSMPTRVSDVGNAVAAAVGPCAAHTAAVRWAVPIYTMTAAADPPEGGTVTCTPELGGYLYGDAVQLEATPADGWTFAGWTCAGGAVLDPGAAQTAMFVTGSCELRAHFASVTQPITISVALDWAWVYQNAPTGTQWRHKSVLTITVTNDPNGNTSYTTEVTRNASSTGQVVIASTADPLVWNIRGGQHGVDPKGPVTLDIMVIGNEHGGTGTTTANLTVRLLGDITGDGAVSGADKLQMNKRLNGLATPGYEARHFDLDGSGGEPSGNDKLIMNKILNGVAVP